jgi:hypothetical protein
LNGSYLILQQQLQTQCAITFRQFGGYMHSGISVRFYRLHAQREALRYRALDARKFLEAKGVTP